MSKRQFETEDPTATQSAPIQETKAPDTKVSAGADYALPRYGAWGTGGRPRPESQAAALAQASGGQLTRAGHALLQLQRDYGNHYVQRVVNHARQTDAPNRTGLPDHLKSGIESLSGLALDNVKVHYNSAKPAQVQALAYTQGTEIHVAPGQEQHLAHEAWHVVQQAQGRVRPTRQMKDGLTVNDDAGLEHEADVMGAEAFTTGEKLQAHELTQVEQQARGSFARHAEGRPGGPVQRKVLGFDHLYELVEAVESQVDELTPKEMERLNEIYQYADNPFGNYTLAGVVEELIKGRVSATDSPGDGGSKDTAKRKDTQGDIWRMYKAEIIRTGTRGAIEQLLTNEGPAGVFLATTVSECNSDEQSDMVILEWQAIVVPDLERLDIFDVGSMSRNGLTTEQNCRLIAEHELTHLKHTWENWHNYANPEAITWVDEFQPDVLPATVKELQALIPVKERKSTTGPGGYIFDRLKYIKFQFNKTKKNNEAPAVMRELRQYLEMSGISPGNKIYGELCAKIIDYDDKCSERVLKKRQEVDVNCCNLF